LSNCTAVEDRLLPLNADAPVVLLVHGCTGSAGDFYTLADIFAFHGQQTVCFNYNDRDSLRVSTAQLTQAITALAGHLNHPDITLIGHSQGGLIARKALGAAQDDPSGRQPPVRFRLVTIAAPFAGIEAARHCGSTTLAVLTLGMTIPICKMISGDKWYEITYASDFIRYPGRLAPEVHTYLKVDTDERDSCRRFDDQGRCREDDFVFSLAEQYHQAIDTDELVNKVEMKAGHVKVIGDTDSAPVKLIQALQAEGIMADTPPEDRAALALLLQDLYHRP
jgi:pimeloyl-ACP methyl ester carboxylesterase